MSRIGNKLIVINPNVTVDVQEGNFVKVTGPKGELSYTFDPEMRIEVKDGHVHVTRPNDSIRMKALHGTTRALIHNMVEGVSNGFKKTLVVEGVGYKFVKESDKVLVVNAGYSHPVPLQIPEGVKVNATSATEITIEGYNKQVVGQFAAEVRAVRGPEPYLGKGIRYKDEIIRRKEGKKSK
ncbi:50S ribosomal protein L6 [Coprobacillus sp. CAG:698]|nr:50S ribosomal protein L6 [Coprobacillus sp. CAG:698]